MSKIKVLTFGVVTEIIGESSLELGNISSTAELMEKLENDYPKLKDTRYVVAVNRIIVPASSPIPENATIAILPPFSGG